METDFRLSIPPCLTSHPQHHDTGRTAHPCETNEIPLNGVLCYCSENRKGSPVRQARAIGAEEIEKDAIKGDLICLPDYITDLTVVRAQT